MKSQYQAIFRQNWKSKKQIGKYYDKTSLEISIVLQEVGLESPTTHKPTQLAFENKLVKHVEDTNTGSYYL